MSEQDHGWQTQVSTDAPPENHTQMQPEAEAPPAEAAPEEAPAPEQPAAEAPAPPPAPVDHRPRSPRIIALMNQKGGVGKTTTTVNVGAALSRAGHRVLLIDLDPQAHLTLSLGIEPEELEHSVYDLLTEPNAKAADILCPVSEHLVVLPAEVNLAGVEAELADRVATGAAQSVLRNKLRDVVTQFDYVLIDCPPSLGLLTVNALTLAREVVVPMQAHFLALQGLSKLLETINMVREGINPNLLVTGVVLCMHEAQTLLASEVTNDLSAFLNSARGTDVPWRDAIVLTPPVRRNIKLAESPSFGTAIFDYAPDSHGAADYAALAKSLAAHTVG